MYKLFGALVLLTSPVFAEDKPPNKPPADKIPVKKPTVDKEKPTGANATDGLTLPANMTVNNDEGFITIQAVCKGQVKFLVVSGVKVKFIANENTLIVSIPCSGGVISVFAVGNVDGKLTDFVSTIITIASSKQPIPPKSPISPKPNPVVKPLHVTFVLDLNKATPQLAQLLNSKTLQKTITDAGNFFRIYDKSSPIITQRGLDKVLQKVGGTNAMIVQNKDGSLALSQAIPTSEADILNILKKLGD